MARRTAAEKRRVKRGGGLVDPSEMQYIHIKQTITEKGLARDRKIREVCNKLNK